MLLPFLALSALPSGVMPGRSGDGTLTLVLCTADGPRAMTVDLGTGENRTAPAGCPWALVPVALPLPDPGMPDRPAVLLPRPAFHTEATDLLPATVPGPRTARAPPTLA